MKLIDFISTCTGDNLCTIYSVENFKCVKDIDKWEFIFSWRIYDAKGIMEEFLQREIISWSYDEYVEELEVFIRS